MESEYFYISKKTGKSFNTDNQCIAILNYVKNIHDKYKDIKNNEWEQIYAGMGCIIFISGDDENIKCFFLHSDEQGQYGIDNTPFVDKLIDGKVKLS